MVFVLPRGVCFLRADYWPSVFGISPFVPSSVTSKWLFLKRNEVFLCSVQHPMHGCYEPLLWNNDPRFDPVILICIYIPAHFQWIKHIKLHNLICCDIFGIFSWWLNNMNMDLITQADWQICLNSATMLQCFDFTFKDLWHSVSAK